jgi:hypothetical protein
MYKKPFSASGVASISPLPTCPPSGTAYASFRFLTLSRLMRASGEKLWPSYVRWFISQF